MENELTSQEIAQIAIELYHLGRNIGHWDDGEYMPHYLGYIEKTLPLLKKISHLVDVSAMVADYEKEIEDYQ